MTCGSENPRFLSGWRGVCDVKRGRVNVGDALTWAFSRVAPGNPCEVAPDGESNVRGTHRRTGDSLAPRGVLQLTADFGRVHLAAPISTVDPSDEPPVASPCVGHPTGVAVCGPKMRAPEDAAAFRDLRKSHLSGRPGPRGRARNPRDDSSVAPLFARGDRDAADRLRASRDSSGLSKRGPVI